MTHFVMECEGPTPAAYIKTDLDLPDGPWYRGSPLSAEVVAEIPSPIVYTRDRPNREGTYKDLYTAESYPLMSSRLLAVLRSVGASNLEVFPACIRNPLTREERLDYVAFNVVGLVAAADMTESVLMGTSDDKLLAVDFHSLVIDEKKAGGLLLFRLAESCSAIVISSSVKEAIERAGIPGMVFYGPGEWAG
jgi:hypothetical protein